MEIGLLSVLALGFILGIKHALEPDHVIAVSTIASQSKKLARSSLSGVFWGIGHSATLFIVGLIYVLMKGEIAEKWAMSLEFLVGLMLVYLGVVTMLAVKDSKVHKHEPPGSTSYLKSMLVGFIHGLAGSGAMVLLTMSTVNHIWETALYILIFGAGTVAGMFLFTTVIGLLFVYGAKKYILNQTLTRLTGALSFLFGIYYMYQLGVIEGLFSLWL